MWWMAIMDGWENMVIIEQPYYQDPYPSVEVRGMENVDGDLESSIDQRPASFLVLKLLNYHYSDVVEILFWL